MMRVEVKHHADGTPYARPYLGTSKVTGRPIRPYRRFPGMTDAEAQRAAEEWVAGLAPAAGMRASTRLSDVMELYMEHVAATSAPTTAKTYRSALERYVLPNIGDMGVAEMRPYTAEGLYAFVAAQGGRGGRPIAASTVAKVHWLLCGAYRWFAAQGIVESNPMLNVPRPAPGEHEGIAFDELEFARLVRALEGSLSDEGASPEAAFRRTAAMAAYLALWTGARCGELLAVSRHDASLVRREVLVGHMTVSEVAGGLVRRPKGATKRGTRNLAVGDEVCGALRAHYAWQEGWLPACALRSPRSTMVLCAHDGGLLRPSKVSAEFSALRDRLGLPPKATFHSLRHTHATWLIHNGADARTVQERLGHARIATTLELYAHVFPGRDRGAADAFSAAARRAGA